MNQFTIHRAVRPETYDGPRCPHGYADAPCAELADSDLKTYWDLVCGAIPEYYAAELARRYECAPGVIDWVRPCPHCRKETAVRRRPLLTYELEQLARALAADLKSAERSLYRLRDDVCRLHAAFAELGSVTRLAPVVERVGFVYLIGHESAVKIGWSDRHPAAPGGRLGELQTATYHELRLMGLVEGTFSLERRVHSMFAVHRLRGEWFVPAQQILAYFKENGIAV